MKLKIPAHIKNIIVTGGGGFIGGCLVRRLLEETNISITNIDKISYASDFKSIDDLLKKSELKTNRYSFFQNDLCNIDQIFEIIDKTKPDYIMHLAAESHVDRSIDNPVEFINSNIIGTFNILEATRRYYLNLKTIKKEYFRFLHISTDEVFGSLNENGTFNEDTKYDPRSPYSASKASSDHLVNAWYHTYKIPVIITNCSNNYGPWQFPEKLIPLVIMKALKNKNIPVYGDGKNIRDWLFVSDHIDGLISAITKGSIGEKYCIGGLSEIENIVVVEKICSLLDKLVPGNESYKKLITFVPDRPGHDRRYSIDPSKICNELKWEPSHNFVEGLEDTVRWYINNIKWCEEIINKKNYNGERLGLNI